MYLLEKKAISCYPTSTCHCSAPSTQHLSSPHPPMMASAKACLMVSMQYRDVSNQRHSFPTYFLRGTGNPIQTLALRKGLLPELMAEPTNARSMSFVGTHEYLAPEIIQGQGHGSAVDWWTFGVFLYELMHGTTPFKGSGNRDTLLKVVGRPLKFPEVPVVSSVAQDLIRSLLVKDPEKRIAYRRGATEIKQHPFFEGVNWALVRSSTPPHRPEPVDFARFARKEVHNRGKKATENGITGNDVTKVNTNDSSHLDFEYF